MTTASSTFDGSESPLSESSVWTSGPGGWADMAKTGGEAHASAAGNDSAARYTGSWDGNHYSTITVGTITTNDSYIGAMTRMASTTDGDGYLFWVSKYGSDVGRCVRIDDDAGSLTFNTLGADFSFTVSSSDQFKIDSNGSTHTLYRNDVSQGTRTDSTYTTGNPGIWAYAQNNVADAMITSWTAADAGTTANVSPIAGTLRLGGNVITVGTSGAIQPIAGTFRLTGSLVGVSLQSNVSPIAGTLRLGGAVPTVTASAAGGVAVTPISGTLTMAGKKPSVVADTTPFPVSIHAGGRYLVDKDGFPFLPIMESAWSAITMLTHSQMEEYLDDRVSKGFNAVQVMAIGKITDHTPNYENAYGENPFTTMTDFATPNPSYFSTVEYFINAAKERGVLVFLWPAYSGYLGDGTEGWAPQIDAESTADLEGYGEYLATLVSQYDNIIWSLGGDYSDSTHIEQQFNIFRGVVNILPTALVTAHGARSSNAYTVLSAQLAEIGSYLLNGIYTDDYEEYTAAATEWARSGPIPFVDLDHQYEGYAGHTADYTMLGQHVSMLSGAKGFMFGNVPVCEFGAGFWGSAVGPAAVLASYMDTDGALRTQYAAALYAAYSWHLLEPKTDTSLVSSSLGTGSGRVAPALASDSSFAMVWTPGVNVTVVMSALAPDTVRARWWDPTTGSYTAIGTYANTGSQLFTAPGTRVLVLDGNEAAVSVLAGSLSFAGNVIGVSTEIRLSPIFRNIQLTGNVIGVSAQINVVLWSGRLSLSGNVPTIYAGGIENVSPISGALRFSGNVIDVAIQAALTVSPVAGRLTFRGNPITVSLKTPFSWGKISKESRTWTKRGNTTTDWTNR